MNTYVLTVAGYEDCPPCTAFGATPAKAKYNAYKGTFEELFDSFSDFVQSVTSIRLQHKFRISDLFTKDIEGFTRTCEYRGIPHARIGMRVSVNGRDGIICGVNSSSNLDVCFDGDIFLSNCHPHWCMVFKS